MENGGKLEALETILSDPFGHWDELDDRQQSILKLASRGRSIKEIGEEIGMLEGTVTTKLYRMLRKREMSKADLVEDVFTRIEGVLAE